MAQYEKHKNGRWRVRTSIGSKRITVAWGDSREECEQRYEEFIRDNEPEDSDTLKTGERHVYNPGTRHYVFQFDELGELVFPADRLQAIKRDYSNWNGKPSTINEICRRYAISRHALIAIVRELGWTHDSSPFTDEETLERSTDELVEDALQQKTQRLWNRFQRADWEQTVLKARKWDEYEQTFLLPYMSGIEESARRLGERRLAEVPKKEGYGKVAAVINPCDLHYGKYGWSSKSGEKIDNQRLSEDLISGSLFIYHAAAALGNVEKIIFPVGSDWFHIDTELLTTTSGTTQDTNASPVEIQIEGEYLAVSVIEMLAKLAPVEVIWVRGNHDYRSSLSLARFLQAWFRNDTGVSVSIAGGDRSYTSYGTNAFMITHGDTVSKVGDMAMVFAHEKAKLWGDSVNRYVLSGHLHHERVQEMGGITRYQFSSLSGTDRWHHKNGYVLARRALGGLVVSENNGVIASITAAE